MRRALVGLLCLVVAAGAASAAPDRAELAKREFEAAKKAVLIEAGTRHAKLGVWCRDAGLTTQATAEFFRAQEVSESQNPWAVKIVELMRRLDDKFWKTVSKHPSKAMLATFDKKVREAELAFQKDRLGLAKDAAKKGLDEESYGEFAAVVRLTDKPLQFDAQGKVVVDAGAIPEDVSARMKKEAIAINERLYLRDAFLLRIPLVKEIFEAEADEIRVRSQRSAKEAADLLAIAKALFPFLEDDLGGRPTRRIGMFVFSDRKTYEAYLEAAKLQAFGEATGMADCGTFVTLVCGEGLDETTLRGIALHEMSHLFQYGVTPVIMPSWYCEGFAETWGGDGTFQWDGAKLKAGGTMSPSRTDALKTKEGYLPLSDLVAADALDLITKDRSKAGRFYTESWALRTYLRGSAGPDVAGKFDRWEVVCRGAALGAEAGKPFSRNTAPSAELFKKMFGPDLPGIETGFRAWLSKL